MACRRPSGASSAAAAARPRRDVVDVSGGDDGWAAGGPPPPLDALERIRVPRAKLEEWLNEPFFERTVRGCVVRLAMGECGVGPGAPALYRVAVVAAVDERGEEYMRSNPGQPTRKGLLLDFGECERRYEMKLVSNQPFDRTELDAYAHVCAAAGAAPPSRAQVDAKLGHLQRASNYSYTEEEVRAKVQQQRAARGRRAHDAAEAGDAGGAGGGHRAAEEDDAQRARAGDRAGLRLRVEPGDARL